MRSFLFCLGCVVLLAAVAADSAPSILVSMPYQPQHTADRCVEAAVVDDDCDAAAFMLDTNHTVPSSTDLLRSVDKARNNPAEASQFTVVHPLFANSGAPMLPGIPSGQLCTRLNTLVLVCTNKGLIDDATVVHMMSPSQPDSSWNASVVVRRQACDLVAVDTVVQGEPVVYGVMERNVNSAADFVWKASGASTKVLARSLQSWHLDTYLSFIGPDRVETVVIPRPQVDCNDTFYADIIEQIQRFHGVDNLEHFRFAWKHARPTVVSVLWALVLGGFQMALCMGLFWKRQRVFFVFSLLLMSIHIPLIGHIKFDAYIVATAAGLLLPFVIGPAVVVWWLCSHPVTAFKLPDRVVADNLFMCSLVVLLHGTFLLVSLIQTTS